MNPKQSEKLQSQLSLLHGNATGKDRILYIFENKNKYDFCLPRTSVCGKRIIGPKMRFKGDEYYMSLVKSGELKLIEILHPKVETPVVDNVEVLKENASQGEKMEKLILDQPDKVTHQGKIERVVQPQPKVIKDHKINSVEQQAEEILLNENPMSGIDIING